jgi:predicted DNA binding protein
MSVIAELTLPARSFELGRILWVEQPTQITLETMVPLGGRPTPFVRVRGDTRATFETSVRDDPAVEELLEIDTHDDETLYSLNWVPSADTLFDKLLEMDVAVLEATGTADAWELQLRFPSHDALSEFRNYYAKRDVEVTIERLYNPTPPEAGQWYGLTPAQREALTLAVEAGYYSLPREISTKELAEEFDISDQAVTERLRRGINRLVSNSLLVTEEDS